MVTRVFIKLTVLFPFSLSLSLPYPLTRLFAPCPSLSHQLRKRDTSTHSHYIFVCLERSILFTLFFNKSPQPIYMSLSDNMQADKVNESDTEKSMDSFTPHMPPEVLQMVLHELDFFGRKLLVWRLTPDCLQWTLYYFYYSVRSREVPCVYADFESSPRLSASLQDLACVPSRQRPDAS